MFETEQEYKAFLTWALEGSTIGQRMQMGPSRDKIPPHWEKFKPIADKLPKTLEEFNGDTTDGTSGPTDSVD